MFKAPELYALLVSRQALMTAVLTGLSGIAPSAFAQSDALPPTTAQVQPAAGPAPSIPASNWTLAQIRAAFKLADADSDGQLSRTEAQYLRIMPRSFEEMDQNKDGVLTRQEYEASFAR